MPPLPPHFRQVWLARTTHPDYRVLEGYRFPELPPEVRTTTTLVAFREILAAMGLDQARYGTAAWNPLAELIQPGQTVTLKPNWVLHENQSGQGLECVVTHTSLIAALCVYLFKALPGRVILGDAPVQGCDIQSLWKQIGLEEWLAPWRDRLEILDFRLIILPGGKFSDVQRGSAVRVQERDYLLFDLGPDSLLEPITREGDHGFRVTMYNPDALQRTHQPGRHQYLVAREMIDADVVFNLPKLKTHKKAGVTGALKNLIGINGHKEYLPHHRKGGADTGGDCYPGGSRAKLTAEELLDRANRRESGLIKNGLIRTAYALNRTSGRTSATIGLEGSWYGNDTIWRTCMDLQRILHYGRADGSLASGMQRAVWSLTDAVVAGQAEGPLAPTPKVLGLISFASSPAAAEWVHALAMHLDPERIPIIKRAFDSFSYPLVDFPPHTIDVRTPAGPIPLNQIATQLGSPFQPPLGWRGHCELTPVATNPIYSDQGLPQPLTIFSQEEG